MRRIEYVVSMMGGESMKSSWSRRSQRKGTTDSKGEHDARQDWGMGARPRVPVKNV